LVLPLAGCLSTLLAVMIARSVTQRATIEALGTI